MTFPMHLMLPLNATLPRDWLIHDVPDGWALRLELKNRGEVAIVRSHLERILPTPPAPDYTPRRPATGTVPQIFQAGVVDLLGAYLLGAAIGAFLMWWGMT